MRQGPGHVAALPSHTVLSLLRQFELTFDGAAVPLPLMVQRLIAFLALSERPQARASVAEALWGEVPDERALALLRTSLWQLRRTAPGIVASGQGRLWLVPGVPVDLREAVAAARAVIATGTAHDGDVETLRHDLLPDWADTWVLLERERFRQLRLHALEACCRALTAAERYAKAIELALDIVAADPLRETAQRALIEAHLAEGNVSEAIRQYQSFARTLRTTLGVEPTLGLRSLLPSPPPRPEPRA